MAYMTVGGIPLRVLTESSSGGEPETSGGDVRAFAGNLRSSRRWAKQQWPRRTGKMTAAEVASLRAVVGSPMGGNVVSCVGDFSMGVTLNCLFTITGIEDVKSSATVVKYRLSILVKEV